MQQKILVTPSFDKFFNFVRAFEIKTSKLNLIWVSRLQVLIQLMHSDLELLVFIKKHLFLTIYNDFVEFTSEHVKLLKLSFQPVLNLKKDNFVGDPFVVMYY